MCQKHPRRVVSSVNTARNCVATRDVIRQLGVNVKSGRCDWVVSTPDCRTKDPKIESALRSVSEKLFFHDNHCDMQPGARATHLSQCLGGLSLPTSVGGCSAYRSLQTDSKVGLRVGSHLALIDFHSEDPSKLSHMTLRSRRWHSKFNYY